VSESVSACTLLNSIEKLKAYALANIDGQRKEQGHGLIIETIHLKERYPCKDIQGFKTRKRQNTDHDRRSVFPMSSDGRGIFSNYTINAHGKWYLKLVSFRFIFLFFESVYNITI